MTNEEKWANTLEKLHDIEPAPFNPDYNEEHAKMAELQAKFMRKIKKELVKLDDNDIHGASGVCNNIEDLAYVFSCAVTDMYSYSIKGGKITHPTEGGQKLADIFNN
jgi:hypothetical protein